MDQFTNSQLIMITEIKIMVEHMKEEGKNYANIRKVCMDEFKDSHWLITDQRQRDEAVAGALFAHAMNDEQREAALELKKIIGYILV